jgi:hypothetical protein
MISHILDQIILILFILKSATSTTLLNKNVRFYLISSFDNSHNALMNSNIEFESKFIDMLNILSI